MSVEVRDSRVDVPGGSVLVRRWHLDESQRPPIVLLHDSLGSIEQWRDFPDALAGAVGRDVLAYDRLGFGKSAARVDRPSAAFVTDEATTFFPAIQRALGLGTFCLFGHSVGGAMALAIAGRNTGCEAVITEAAQAFVEERTQAGIRSARAQFDEPQQFEKLVRWHGAKARWVLDAWTGVWLSPEYRSWSLDDELARVSCPVLAIHGDGDEYGSVEFPRRIAGRVRGPAELAILTHCGHIPHRERRAEVLRLCASFLARTPAS